MIRGRLFAGFFLPTTFHLPRSEVWLGWEDSNLRVQVPKTRVLPLDDTPIFNSKNPKYEIGNPCLRRSAFAQAGEYRNPKNTHGCTATLKPWKLIIPPPPPLEKWGELLLPLVKGGGEGFRKVVANSKGDTPLLILKVTYSSEFLYYTLLTLWIQSSVGFHC